MSENSRNENLNGEIQSETLLSVPTDRSAPARRSAVMTDVRLMEEEGDLLSGLRLDPDSEDIGFGEMALRPWDKPTKPKKPKKRILLWILLAALIVAIVATGVTLLVNYISARANAPAPLDSENFPALYATATGELGVTPNGWDESYTAADLGDNPTKDFSDFIKTNNNGSMIFFADSAQAVTGGQYNLYYRKTNEREPSDSADEKGYRIASGVSGEFAVSSNGKYVAYLKDAADGKGKLFVSNLHYETAIEERDVTAFSFSKDNKYIMFHKNSGEQYDTVYIKKLSDNSEKVKIDSSVVRVISCSDDFERIYYLTLSDVEMDSAAQDITGQLGSDASSEVSTEQQSDTSLALTEPPAFTPDESSQTPEPQPPMDGTYIGSVEEPTGQAPSDGETADTDEEAAGQTSYDEQEAGMLEIEDVLCTFKLKVMSRDPIVVVDGVTSVSEISEKGNFAFTMGSTTVLGYDDVVDDEHASTDMVIHEPTREEFTVTTEVPNAPTQNTDGTLSQTNKTVTTFDQESYNRAMEAYQEKARRDAVRAVLKDKTIDITNNILYCFVNGSIIKVSEDCDQYYALDPDAGLVAYTKRETESIKRYSLTDLLENPTIVMEQTGKSNTVTLYAVSGAQINELSRTFSYKSITQQGDKLYYFTDFDSDKQKGSLMRLDKSGTAIKLLDDVADYRINEENGDIAFLTNLGDELKGELYLSSGKTGERVNVANDVRIGGFTMDENSNVATLSGDDNTLICYDGANTYTIAENTSFFAFKGKGRIFFMQNYDPTSGGTLSCFNGSDIDNIAERVVALAWPYNETVYADGLM